MRYFRRDSEIKSDDLPFEILITNPLKMASMRPIREIPQRQKISFKVA